MAGGEGPERDRRCLDSMGSGKYLASCGDRVCGSWHQI
jgi:hypothetical protein